jgi:hypothetical protein
MSGSASDANFDPVLTHFYLQKLSAHIYLPIIPKLVVWKTCLGMKAEKIDLAIVWGTEGETRERLCRKFQIGRGRLSGQEHSSLKRSRLKLESCAAQYKTRLSELYHDDDAMDPYFEEFLPPVRSILNPMFTLCVSSQLSVMWRD